MVHDDFFDLSGKVFFAGAVRIGKDSNEGESHGCQQNECDCHLLHAPYAIILPPEIDDLSRKVSPWRLALRKNVTYNKYIIIVKRKRETLTAKGWKWLCYVCIEILWKGANGR